MINVITFGKATKTIGKLLNENYPSVFSQFHVDDYVNKCDSHAEYEKEAEKIDLDLTNGENLFIMNPASDVSGTLLVLLEKTNSRENKIVCILPDFDFVSKVQAQQSRFVANVLQELARSGAIGELILINQKYIENYIQNLSIKNYYEQIDEYISSALATWLWCRDEDSLVDNTIDRIPTTRIGTLGFYDIEENHIHMFSDLSYLENDIPYPLEIDFYFILDKKTVEESPELMTKIKQSIKDKKQKEFAGASIGFKILEGLKNYTLTHIRTSKIQKL